MISIIRAVLEPFKCKAECWFQNKLQQLSSYILSRKDSQNLKSLYFVVLSAHTLSTNQHFIPVAVSLDTLAFSAASKDEKVKVSVTSLHLNRLGSKFDVFYSGEKSKEAEHRVKSE